VVFGIMNEIRFLHKNKLKWAEFEQLIEKGYASNPDRVSELFINLTDDLAYARTYFPNSSSTRYLNQITQRAHQIIYQNQPLKKGRILTFWRIDFPLLFFSARKELMISFLVFLIAFLIGLLSNTYDPDFVRIIMGDSYVNMTLANIEKGDPLAVYKQMNQTDMFLYISINNIYISFMAFVYGIFTSIGTGYILLKNGIMLGTFQGFLAQKGFLPESMSTIWIHGTLEIFAIIVAGAAGIVMGNGLIFPGTYSRLKSFRNGAVRGIKMVAGLIPVFILAALLEGFVTRYTQAPVLIKAGIIGMSLLFIVCYFFYYPYKLTLKTLNNGKPNS
jgi:uncharacterized membrane protein SpoIIM required for sporulation